MKKQMDVVLFLDRVMIRKKLSEVLEHVKNGFLLKEYFNGKMDLAFPFLLEEERVVVNWSLFSDLEVKLGNELIGYCIVHHNDLFTIYDTEHKINYQILFLEHCKLNYTYDSYQLEIEKTITIGRSLDNLICIPNNSYISKEIHVVIENHSNSGWYIKEKAELHRLYINGVQCSESRLQQGDQLFLAGVSMVFGTNWIAVPKELVRCHGMNRVKIPYRAKEEEEMNQFNISPRILHPLHQETYKIEPPPLIARVTHNSILLTMGPSLTMSIATIIGMGFTISNTIGKNGIVSVLSSLSVTIGMFIGAVLWPILRRRNQKKLEAVAEAERQRKYRSYIEQKENLLKNISHYNLELFSQELAPPPKFICHFLDKRKDQYSYYHRLWERLKDDPDFLNIRLGTGEIKNPVHIEVPEEKFSMIQDELKQEPQRLKEEYSTIKDAPITVSLLTYRSIGIIAETHAVLNQMAKKILVNLIGLHSPADLKIIMICDSIWMNQYQWLRKIPHMWDNNHKIRFIGSSQESVRSIFSYIEEQLNQIDKEIEIPYFVLFIQNPELMKRERLLRYLKNSERRLSVVYLYGSFSKIPNDCNVLLECKEEGGKYYRKEKNQFIVSDFKNDRLDEEDIHLFSNKISAFSAIEEKWEFAIPESISFLELYQVGNVEALHLLKRWNRSNIEKSLAVPIGIMQNGEIFSLDIHEKYHGSHGLVAGTTGSGKSEFLQTYILSLMVNFSPEEIAFVLIDYKGGDMLKPFQHTPYIAASLDNMSSNMLQRALISLKAENERRQKMLAKAKEQLQIDKLDINSYQKYRKEGKLKNPMPHLVIIVDEFAELKAQNWEFLEQLVNIARIGRSLGVHLILATQRPSGQVDPQIWSNARFRVCLKVQTRTDSSDMIGRGDAAFIKNPGEFYTTVGYDELFVHAQSAYSGAEYIEASQFVQKEESTVALVDETASVIRSVSDNVLGNRTGKQQISVIIQHIIETAKNHFQPTNTLWLPSLGRRLYIEDYITKLQSDNPDIPIAIIDDVKNQAQPIYQLNLRNQGNIAIYGLAETGKTTMIQTILTGLAYKYTPEEWCFYYLDMAGGATGYYCYLPHCGGVISGEREDEIAAILQLLQREIQKRKQLFRKNNCNSYAEYNKTVKSSLPMITIVVDLYTPFTERYFKLQTQLIQIVSSGKTYGVYSLITSNSKDGIYYKIKEQMNTYFMLYLNDVVTQQILLKISSIPTLSEQIPGRGVLVIGEGKERRAVEFQTLLYEKAETDSERVDKLISSYKLIKSNWKGKLPKTIQKVEEMKKEETEKELEEQSGNRNIVRMNQSILRPDPINRNEACLLIGKKDNQLYGILFERLIALPLTGLDREQNLNCMQMLLKQVQQMSNRRIMLFDPQNQLKKKQEIQTYCCNSEEEIDRFVSILNSEFKQRLEEKKKLEKERKSQKEIYDGFKEKEKYFIFINEFDLFFRAFSNEANDILSKIVQNCGQIGIYFIVSEVYPKLLRYRQQALYRGIFQSSYGVICDGQISQQSGIYLHSAVGELHAKLYDWKSKEREWVFYEEEKAVPVKCL